MEILKALVLEDEPSVSDFIVECLHEFGHSVVAVCTSGEEAVEIAKKERPNLLLADILLNGKLSGIETADAIKKMYDIPVMFITGHEDNQYLDKAKKIKPFGYLIKPFKISDLKSLIDLGIMQYKNVKEIKLREAWLNTTLNNIWEGIITLDENGKILFLNPQAKKMLNKQSHKFIGQTINNELFIYSSKNSVIPNIFNEVQNNMLKKFSGNTLYVKRKDNEFIPIVLQCSKINNNNQPSGYVITIKDISETEDAKLRVEKSQKELELINYELEESLQSAVKMSIELEIAYEELKQTFNSVADGLIVIDKNHAILKANDSFKKMFGDIPVGSKIKCYDLFNSEYCNTDKCAMKMIFSGKKHVEREEHLKLKNGEVVPCIVSTTPLIQGKLAGIVQNIKNISSRKIMEQQLVQAQKLESIGQLAAGIAHEINTPTQYTKDNLKFLNDSFNNLNNYLKEYESILNKIFKNNNQILTPFSSLKKKFNIEFLLEEIPEALADSIEGVKRIIKIVKAMKEFSHPGKSEKEAVNINSALETTISVTKNEWKYVADMETNFHHSLPHALCNNNEINQVFLNLITNAAHAIKEILNQNGELKGKINISTMYDENWVIIKIKDTGSGIPEKVRDKIFNPFFTTKEVGKGTGQGLSICHNIIVENHQGEINFESEVGKGTTFIIKLPLQTEI